MSELTIPEIDPTFGIILVLAFLIEAFVVSWVGLHIMRSPAFRAAWDRLMAFLRNLA